MMLCLWAEGNAFFIRAQCCGGAFRAWLWSENGVQALWLCTSRPLLLFRLGLDYNLETTLNFLLLHATHTTKST